MIDAHTQAARYGYAVRDGQLHSSRGKPLGVFLKAGKRGRLRYETADGTLLASGPPDGIGGFLEKFYYAQLMPTERPCAAPGLLSYRYPSRYGYVMIGAKDDADALREAARSLTSEQPEAAKLEKWNGTRYARVEA